MYLLCFLCLAGAAGSPFTLSQGEKIINNSNFLRAFPSEILCAQIKKGLIIDEDTESGFSIITLQTFIQLGCCCHKHHSATYCHWIYRHHSDSFDHITWMHTQTHTRITTFSCIQFDCIWNSFHLNISLVCPWRVFLDALRACHMWRT